MKKFSFFLLLLFSNVIVAYSSEKLVVDIGHQKLCFEENKGQITDQYGRPRTDIQYILHGRGINVFIGAGRIYYQFAKSDKVPDLFHKANLKGSFAKPERISFDMYRLDMKLIGADTTITGIPSGITADYNHYYKETSNISVTHCYSRITYKNIYPGIDWLLYVNNGKLEYDFVVNTNANIANIAISFPGADSLIRIGQRLKIFTPLGDIYQSAPNTFEKKTGKAINSGITLSNNTLGFEIPDVKNKQIIIDPALEWGTYYGGTGRDVVNANSCDKNGNIFISGFTQSINNIATTGTHQTTYTGDFDAFIAKFSSSGDLLWGTYFGGNDMTFSESITNDSFGNSFITGYTYSTDIATPSAHQTYKPATGMTAFLAKFDNSGMLIWSTYYGLNGESHGRHICCDDDGCVFLSGSGSADSGISTTGSFQDTFKPPYNNGFLAKFTSEGNLSWGTYFGWSVGIYCVYGRKNDIYLTGLATDSSISTTPGCHQSVCGGDRDCFIAKFDTLSNLIWSTYYGGSSTDYPQAATQDDSSIYISGTTSSLNGIATTSSWQQINGSNGDAFLARFSKDGILKWGTYYGGSGEDISYGVAYDGIGTIYMAGNTNSDNDIATPSSLHSSRQGYTDIFMSAFSQAGERLWGTYYGGEMSDYLNALTAYKGAVYLSGFTASISGIATEDGYQFIYSDSIDGYLIKFNQWSESVTNISNEAAPYIYPNPNNGHFFVGHAPDGSTISIFDFRGTCLKEINTFSDITPFSLDNLPPGFYFLRITSYTGVQSLRFVIE